VCAGVQRGPGLGFRPFASRAEDEDIYGTVGAILRMQERACQHKETSTWTFDTGLYSLAAGQRQRREPIRKLQAGCDAVPR